MDDDAERSALPNTWLRKLGIATVSVFSGVFAVLTAMLFVSNSPWIAIGPLIGNAAVIYVAYRFLFPPANGRKFSFIVVLWIITTIMMVVALSIKKWVA